LAEYFNASMRRRFTHSVACIASRSTTSPRHAWVEVHRRALASALQYFTAYFTASELESLGLKHFNASNGAPAHPSRIRRAIATIAPLSTEKYEGT
jgi:hypothetical protein